VVASRARPPSLGLRQHRLLELAQLGIELRRLSPELLKEGEQLLGLALLGPPPVSAHLLGKPMRMRVVVGTTGNVGTSLVQSLAEGSAVTAVLGGHAGRRHGSRRRPSGPPRTSVSDDLLPHFRNADVVVHLAWRLQLTHNPVTTWEGNVVGADRVFQAVRRAEVPALVYASSVGPTRPAPRTGRWTSPGRPMAGPPGRTPANRPMSSGCSTRCSGRTPTGGW
jgi:hypothetical protein